MRVRVTPEYYAQLKARAVQQLLLTKMDTSDDDLAIVFDTKEEAKKSTEGKSDDPGPVPSPSSALSSATTEEYNGSKLGVTKSNLGTTIPMVDPISDDKSGNNANGTGSGSGSLPQSVNVPAAVGTRVQPRRACQTAAAVPVPPRRCNNGKLWSLILKEAKKAEKLRKKEEREKLAQERRRKREAKNKQDKDFNCF